MKAFLKMIGIVFLTLSILIDNIAKSKFVYEDEFIAITFFIIGLIIIIESSRIKK